MKFKMFLTVLVAVSVLAGCSSTSSSSARGYEMRIRYAEVTAVNREQQPSAAPAGAIVGGFTGLILSQGRSTRSQVASGIGGAALGAIATSALEGDRLAYAYSLRYLDGTTTRFVTEKGYLQRGDCVSVERGQYSNIRRVPNSLCEGGRRPMQIDTSIREDAQLCHDAKDQLLASSTQEDIDVASRKIEILCAY